MIFIIDITDSTKRLEIFDVKYSTGNVIYKKININDVIVFLVTFIYRNKLFDKSTLNHFCEILK